MYYLQEPPASLVAKVSSAIRTEVQVSGKEYWFSFFSKNDLQLISVKDFAFDHIDSDKISIFVNNILNREHLGSIKNEVMEILREKYSNYITLFSENLGYMGYSIMILRKRDTEIDDELFTSKAYETPDSNTSNESEWESIFTLTPKGSVNIGSVCPISAPYNIGIL